MTIELMPFEEICKPDPRQESFVRFESESQDFRPTELRDFYDGVASIRLTIAVPEDVAKHFLRARHLFLYSWFCYDLTTPAQAQSYASVEWALREKHTITQTPTPKRPGLKTLMMSAVRSGWLKDGGFPHLRFHSDPSLEGFAVQKVFDPDGTEFCETLAASMPNLRNYLAHGSSFLITPSGALGTLERCAAVINQLFPQDTAAQDELS